MLDTRRIKVLCEVARHGSFSGAAEALGYTQPAISRQIATLEAEVGTVLVRRVPQGAVLTDAGRLLVKRGEAILLRLQDAEDEVRALCGLGSGTLRMATFPSAAMSIVPRAVAGFRDLHPGVELTVSMFEPVDSIPRLRAGEFDLALSLDPRDDPAGSVGGHVARGDIEVVPLFDDPMYVALPAGHRLGDAPELSMSDFAAEPWMLSTGRACPDARLFMRACHDAGFEPRIAFQNDDYGAILGFVAAGVGVALVPDIVTRAVRGDVIIRDLDPPPPPRPISVILPAGFRSPSAVAMLEVLQTVGEAWVRDRPAMADRTGAVSV
jgi:DNA-binding transcriptional LysR family regulator